MVKRDRKQERLYRYSLATLSFNVLVILWGAYVRATGAGAGCGSHWPLCNGELLPRSPVFETVIEFTHRLTSGVAFLLVLGLWWFVRNLYPKAHTMRRFAAFALVFMILEALIGAGLVLFELVAFNASVTRAAVGAFHLMNTFLLLAMIALVMDGVRRPPEGSFSAQDTRGILLMLGMVGFLLVSMSGAIAALGDTIFPSESFLTGVKQELSTNTHFLIRLRIWHPIVALIATILTLVALRLPVEHRYTESGLQLGLTVFLFFQLLAGVMNVLLLAPVWMQILHLLTADLIWIGLVLYVNQTQRKTSII